MVVLFSVELFSQKADSIQSHQIDEVMVRAMAKPSSLQSSIPLQIITQEDIQRIGVQSVADAVRRLAGVNVKDYGGIGGLKTVSIRGFNSQHTGVSYDGIVVGDAQSGQVDIGRFSIENVSFITLTIGHPDDIFQSARHFSFVGVLGIKTNQPVFDKHKDYKIHTLINAGSFGLFNPSIFYAHKLSKNWSITVDGNWLRSDGTYPFKFDNGSVSEKRKRYNSDVNTLWSEAELFGNIHKNGTLRLKAHYYDSERGLPGSTISLNTYAGDRLHDKNFFIQSNYENKINDKLMLKGLGKVDRTFTKYSISSINYDELPVNRYIQLEYYVSVAALYQPTKELSFSLAQDYIHNRADLHFSDVEMENEAYPSHNNVSRNSLLTVVNGQFKNSKLVITSSILGGYYFESVEKGVSPKDKKRLSPAMNVSYKPFQADLRFRASYKDIFRLPTFNDMYYSQVGNRNLRPETTKQLNAGLTWVTDAKGMFDFMSLSSDAYYNKIKDKILASPSRYIWTMMNLDNVTFKGVDVKAAVEKHFPSGVSTMLNASYSYQHATDDDTGDQIPYTPKHLASAALSVETKQINVSYSLMASGTRYSKLQLVAQNKLAPYVDHTVSLNRSFRWQNSDFRLQLDLLNLADKNYEVMKNYPMPGRSYRFWVSWTF